MSGTVLVVAFTLLCLSEIDGMYAKDPRFLARLGGDQGYAVNDADELKELIQFDDKFVDLPSVSLANKKEIENLPYNNGYWYADRRGQDEHLNAVQGQLPTSRDEDNVVQTLMKRYLTSLGHVHNSRIDQRQRRGDKRGQLYLNHLARMNK